MNPRNILPCLLKLINRMNNKPNAKINFPNSNIIVRPVVFQVHTPLSWKIRTGSRMKAK